MTTLHIVNKSPEQPSIISRCLKFSSKNDSLLLIEDGVYFALHSTINTQLSNFEVKNIKIYALEEDLIARGISDKTHNSIKTVSYDGFVELTASHNNSTSWY